MRSSRLMTVNKDFFPIISKCFFIIPHKHVYSIYFSLFPDIVYKKIILKVKRGKEHRIEERCVNIRSKDTDLHPFSHLGLPSILRQAVLKKKKILTTNYIPFCFLLSSVFKIYIKMLVIYFFTLYNSI